jgi:hypothetical protein
MSHKFKITIDKTKVSGVLTNFPFMFSDDCPNIPSGFWTHVVNPSGSDIRFYDTDGVTELKREIVLYDSGSGDIEAWVQIPTLSSAANKEIWCQYGGSTAANSTSMWDDIHASAIYHGQNAFNDSTSPPANGVES